MIFFLKFFLQLIIFASAKHKKTGFFTVYQVYYLTRFEKGILHSFRVDCCRARSIRCSIAWTSHNTFYIAGFMVILPQFAKITGMASRILAWQIHTKLSSSRRNDGYAESWCLGHDDCNGVSINLCFHTCRFGSTHHSACCRSNRMPGSNIRST